MDSRPLGLILPFEMDQGQRDAHEKALASRPLFAMVGGVPAGPVKVMLTDFWKDADVAKDIGMQFPGFRQITGSCVGASSGNWIFTLAAIQRKLADAPTTAFIPFWPYQYGRTRQAEGDRGQGEGAVDSVMGQTVQKGVLQIEGQTGLPQFDASDGLALTKSIEMQWSMVSSASSQYDPVATKNPVGTVATLTDTAGIFQAIVNGYPVIDGCSMYIGHGSVQGSGDQACALGTYDGNGGHSTCLLGAWDHPSLGRLFLYSNQWNGSTYPTDPAGGGRCCVWVKEADVQKHLFNSSNQGQVMAASHLTYFPAQPQVLTWDMA
jgi:hypothetical protein